MKPVSGQADSRKLRVALQFVRKSNLQSHVALRRGLCILWHRANAGSWGMVSIGSAFESARATVLNAIIGTRAIGAQETAEGLSFAARAALTLLVFAASTIIWWGARSFGVLGTAALYFPATLLVTLLAGWEFGLVILIASWLLVWRVAHSQFVGTTLVVFAMAGVLQLLI